MNGLWEEWPNTGSGYQLRDGDYVWGSYIQMTPSSKEWAAHFNWPVNDEEKFYEERLFRTEAGARAWVTLRYLIVTGCLESDVTALTCFGRRASDCSCVACTQYPPLLKRIGSIIAGGMGDTISEWEVQLLRSKA
jgi:hypothetical protein